MLRLIGVFRRCCTVVILGRRDGAVVQVNGGRACRWYGIRRDDTLDIADSCVIHQSFRRLEEARRRLFTGTGDRFAQIEIIRVVDDVTNCCCSHSTLALLMPRSNGASESEGRSDRNGSLWQLPFLGA